MKSFIHANARTVAEAVKLLKRYNGKAKVNAGGTDLLGVLKDRILPEDPDAIINIKTIPGLDYIRKDSKGLKIGALTSLSDICSSPKVREGYSVLAEAAYAVATPQIRNMATLGGNLCQDVRCWYYRYPNEIGGRILCLRKGSGPCLAVKGDNRYHAILEGKKCFAVCPSDTAIALTALGAKLKIAGSEGRKIVPIKDFFLTLGDILMPDEMITEVQIPKPPKKAKQTFIKFVLRKPVDFAIVSVASILAIEGGVCSEAAIVLGAVAPTPFRAVEAEKVIKGKVIDTVTSAKAAEAAVMAAKPLSKNAYKIEITKTLIKRSLLGSS
jgi:xanthine dehydrogenase YagS FAD-binding subunit